MPLAVRAVIRILAVAFLAIWMQGAAGAETPIPPTPNQWVTDAAGILSPQTQAAQNDRLREYERATGHQVLVYIAPTTGGVPIEDWAVNAFARWKVGRKSLDDGVVLFIFTQDRTLRIEVGYGLEPKIPDALASRIIRETIAPALQAGQPDRAVTQGLDRILQLAGGANSANAAASSDQDTANAPQLSTLDWVLIAIGLFVLLALIVRSPLLALSLVINILSSSRGGGGGGFGGGGFSGGGGRSGGGGASGSW